MNRAATEIGACPHFKALYPRETDHFLTTPCAGP